MEGGKEAAVFMLSAPGGQVEFLVAPKTLIPKSGMDAGLWYRMQYAHDRVQGTAGAAKSALSGADGGGNALKPVLGTSYTTRRLLQRLAKT
jgi:hypothetical protein